MKTINYRGMTFEVEDHFKYIAMDVDGMIFAYECKPIVSDGEWLNVCGEVLLLKGSDKSWENSLESI